MSAKYVWSCTIDLLVAALIFDGQVARATVLEAFREKPSLYKSWYRSLGNLDVHPVWHAAFAPLYLFAATGDRSSLVHAYRKARAFAGPVLDTGTVSRWPAAREVSP